MNTRLLCLTIIALTFGALVAACSNPATPKDCVHTAEAAGAPQAVLDFLNNPTGELGQSERFTIRQFLNHTALNDACQLEIAQLHGQSSPASAGAPLEEGVSTAMLREGAAGGDQRSLEAFGSCVAHYAQEIEYLPAELPLGEKVVQIAHGFDQEAKQWMSVGLCLEYAPRPRVDDVSGKCLVTAMRWYRYEFPESEHLALPVAGVACLPAYWE